MDPATLQDIQAKITRNGLRFSVPFGGYKSRGLPCSPHINWAEVLWLDYLRQYAEPMVTWVNEDIEFALSYMSGVLQFINGTTIDEQETYLQDLDRLLQIMSGEGIRFRLVDLAEHVGGKTAALAQVIAQYERLRSALPELSKEKLASAARNCLDQTQTAEAALRCEAMEMLPERRGFNKFGKHIQLTHIRGASLSVHIGSCRSSIVQPWVGLGVFEHRNGLYVPRILGQSGMGRKIVHASNLNMFNLGLSARAIEAQAIFPQLSELPIIEYESADDDAI